MEKRKILFYGVISMFILMFFASVFAEFASADAWWGYGARRPDWVLSHGGTIIRFEIENISGEPEEYKAVMYDADGDYVEKEFGTKGLFDDAKNGVYKIKAIRGNGNLEFRTSVEGGKKFDDIIVTAHPGETMKIKFNYKKKKVSMTTDYVKPVPRPVVKPAVVSESDPVVEVENSVEEIVMMKENEESFAEKVEDFVHPDALAMESGQQVFIKQGNPNQQTNEESASIFKKIWISILKFFSFA